ncbi:hypothetical protein MMC30_005788 [Trapelia coarctata]|nr:hypothetical protein [Trapelia coarctata]
MSARAHYPLSVEELETVRQKRDKNLTSEPGLESTHYSKLIVSIPESSGLNEILRRWNLGVSIYRSNLPSKQSALAESQDVHRQLMPFVASAPLLREETKTTIFKFLFFNRGLIASYQGDFHAAVKNFEKSISLDNNFAISFLGVGIAYYNLGHYVKAARAFRSIKAIMASYGLRRLDTEMTINVTTRDQGTQTDQTDLTSFKLARDLDSFVLNPIPNGKTQSTDGLKERLIWRLSSEFVDTIVKKSIDAQEIKESAKNEIKENANDEFKQIANDEIKENAKHGNGEDDQGETSFSESMTDTAPDNVLLSKNKGKERKRGDYANAARAIDELLHPSATGVKSTEHTNLKSIAPAYLAITDNKGEDDANDCHEDTFGYIDIMLDLSSEHTNPKHVAPANLAATDNLRKDDTDDSYEDDTGFIDMMLGLSFEPAYLATADNMRKDYTEDSDEEEPDFIDMMLDFPATGVKGTEHTVFKHSEATNLSEPLTGSTLAYRSPAIYKGNDKATSDNADASNFIDTIPGEHTQFKPVEAASPSKLRRGVAAANLPPTNFPTANYKGKNKATDDNAEGTSFIDTILGVSQANVIAPQHTEFNHVEAASPSKRVRSAAPANRPQAIYFGKNKATDDNADGTSFLDRMLNVSSSNVKITENTYPEYGEASSGSKSMTSGAPASFPLTNTNAKDTTKGKNGEGGSYFERMASRFPSTFRLKSKPKCKNGEGASFADLLTGAPTTNLDRKKKSVAEKRKIKPIACIPPGNISEPIHKGAISGFGDLIHYLNNATTEDAADYSVDMGYHQAITEVTKSPSCTLSPDGFPHPALRRKLSIPENFLKTPTAEHPVSFHETVSVLATTRSEVAAMSVPLATPAPYQSLTREITDEELLYHEMQRDMVRDLVMSEAGSPIPAPVSPILETSATAPRGSHPSPPRPNYRTVAPLAPRNWTPPAGLEVLMPIVYVRPDYTAADPEAALSPAPADYPLRRVSVPREQLGPMLASAIADEEAKAAQFVEEKRRVRKETTSFLKEATLRRRLARGMAAVPAPLPVFCVEDWTEGEAVAGPSTAPLVPASGLFSPVVGKPRAGTDAVALYHRPGVWGPHVPIASADLYFHPGDEALVTPTKKGF